MPNGYVLGQVNNSRIQSEVEDEKVSIEDNNKKLVYPDTLRVKLREHCTCDENVAGENKSLKSLSDSTKKADRRIQVRMPWNENGPLKHSNYCIALKRMQSAAKPFQRKECFAVVNDEVQKLLEQYFVNKSPH